MSVVTACAPGVSLTNSRALSLARTHTPHHTRHPKGNVVQCNAHTFSLPSLPSRFCFSLSLSLPHAHTTPGIRMAMLCNAVQCNAHTLCLPSSLSRFLFLSLSHTQDTRHPKGNPVQPVRGRAVRQERVLLLRRPQQRRPARGDARQVHRV